MPEWQVTIRATLPGELTEDQQEAITEAGRNFGHQSTGRSLFRTRAEAGGPAEAAAAAERAFLGACRRAGVPADVREVRAVLWEDVEAGTAGLLGDLAGIAEVAAILGVSRQSAQQATKRRDFPPRLDKLASGPVWEREAVIRFRERVDRKPGRPRNPEA